MPKIALITGTFGSEVQNGVGRFLHGLKQWSEVDDYPLKIYSAGHHLRNYEEIHNVHALSFPIPGGFHAIEGYYLLEGRRKQLARALKAAKPDVVHISTPEALGMTALAIAKRQRRLKAATYHTDFPAFVERVVHDHLERLRNDQRLVLRPGRPGNPQSIKPTAVAEFARIPISQSELLRVPLPRTRVRAIPLASALRDSSGAVLFRRHRRE
ncbi:MAG TPA: glycosyltransferase [Gemmataceae bacterium]|nr:glycosyltransferase [Gemmataceae bacterium]